MNRLPLRQVAWYALCDEVEDRLRQTTPEQHLGRLRLRQSIHQILAIAAHNAWVDNRV